MKLGNKKLVTLACATCLTMGMGAVALADTVELGYGQYANTSAGVKAVAIAKVPTDATHRTAEQNKMLADVNKNIVETVNEFIAKEFSVKLPAFTADALDGSSIYQLSGTDNLGHHRAYLAQFNYSDDVLNQTIAMDKEIAEKGSDSDKNKVENRLSSIVPNYSKSNAEEAISKLKSNEISGQELDTKMARINSELEKSLGESLALGLAQDKKMSAVEKEEVTQLIKKLADPFTLGATYVRYEPVQTQYGIAAKGVIRGNVQYDGFKMPGTIIGYAIPTKDGVITQYLVTEDTSYDYWNRELDYMNQTKAK